MEFSFDATSPIAIESKLISETAFCGNETSKAKAYSVSIKNVKEIQNMSKREIDIIEIDDFTLERSIFGISSSFPIPNFTN